MKYDPKRSRSERVILHVDGDDEFSVASVDPRKQSHEVALDVEKDASRTRSTMNERTLWRLFRKLVG